MKRLLLFTSLILSAYFSFSQNAINLGKGSQGIKVGESSSTRMDLNFSYQGIDHYTVKTNQGEFEQLVLPGSYRSGKIGEPQLPSTKKIIEIPAGSKVSIEVVSYEETELNLKDYGIDNQLIPYQPSYPKSVDPSKQEFKIDKSLYQKDAYQGVTMASVETIGTLRGVTMAQVTINPVDYNPAMQTLKVYNNIDVEITFTGGNSTKTVENKTKTSSPYFNTIYNQFISSTSLSKASATKDSYTDNPDLTTYPVKYLIVTDPAFESQLADFVAWKILKGFKVVMVTTDEIGNTASEIKSWIQTQYDAATEDDPAPSFLLLVGDTGQVPASATGTETTKKTDLYYACMDGSSDFIPDMYYGRLSAETTTELQNMLDKILYYEKYQFDDPSYLNDITLIAGVDSDMNPVVGQPTINYGTTNYFNATNGFTNVNAYLSSYTSCYANDKIKVSMINYTAHGTEVSWYDPSMTKTILNNVSNSHKYPLAVANCCLSADFGYSAAACFGEAWMRKADGGAVAYIGSSPESYWYEDFYWAVGAHPFVSGSYPTFDGSTLGAYDAPFVSDYLCVDAMVFIGNLAVTEAYDQGYVTSSDYITFKYYWEGYNCLGDPSLNIYFKEGASNTVSYDETTFLGQTSFTVNADSGSYVAVSQDTVLLGVGIVPSSGQLIMDIDAIPDLGTIDVVVTRHQYIPFIGTAAVVSPSDSYLKLNAVAINDDSGDQFITVGEAFYLDLNIKNIGGALAEGARVSVSSTSEYIKSISDNTSILVGDIAVNDSVWTSNANRVELVDYIPDGQKIEFTITMSDNSENTYQAVKTVTVHSPAPQLATSFSIDDYNENNNYLLESSETGEFVTQLTNTGSAPLNGYVIMGLVSPSTYITMLNDSISIDSLSSDTLELKFTIQAAANIPAGTQIKVYLKAVATGCSQYFDSVVYTLNIGLNDLVVGTGTTVVSNYPFNNYYENNKSQMLYYASELGSGVRTITGIAFYVSSATTNSSYRVLKNFTAKIKAVSNNALTEYVDMTDAYVVYGPATFTLSGNTGWEDINFSNDYLCKGDSNLLVEIVWGDNGYWTNNFTKVYATSTTAKTVAAGYHDSETPPSLSSLSTSRPNITFYADSAYSLTLLVLDNKALGSLPVEGATVQVLGDTLVTDENGRVTYFYADQQSNLSYTVTKSNYYLTSGVIDLVEHTTRDTIVIDGIPNNFITFSVSDETSVLADIPVQINDETEYTDNSGLLIHKAYTLGWYYYSIQIAGYVAVTDSINLISDTTINIVLNDSIITPTILSVEELTGNQLLMQWKLNNQKSMLSYSVFLDDLEQPIATGITTNHYTFSGLQNKQSYKLGIKAIYSSGSSEADSLTLIYNAIYLATFTVVDGEDSIAGASVTCNGVTQISDSIGQALFYLQSDTLSYSIQASGYCPQSGNDTLVADTSIVVYLIDLPNITLLVVNSDSVLLNGAMAVLGNDTAFTDSSGTVIFTQVTPGDYPCSVSYDSYFSYNELITVHETSLTKTIVLQPEQYNFTFYVLCDALPIEGASISFNDETQLTDSLGVTVFNYVPANQMYAYNVSKSGYLAVSGTLTVDSINTEITLTLSQETYTVTFNVYYNQQVVSNATVYFNDNEIITNENGQALFNDVVPAEYNYQVQNESYSSYSGTITVDSNEVVDVWLNAASIINIQGSVVKIYPNPSTGIVNMEWNSTTENRWVQVFDEEGRILIILPANDPILKLNLTGLVSGLYLINVIEDNQVSQFKVIIE